MGPFEKLQIKLINYIFYSLKMSQDTTLQLQSRFANDDVLHHAESSSPKSIHFFIECVTPKREPKVLVVPNAPKRIPSNQMKLETLYTPRAVTPPVIHAQLLF